MRARMTVIAIAMLATTLAWARPGHRDPILSVAFSPDGTRMASTDSANNTKIWDLGSGQVLHTMHWGGGWGPVAFSSDGTLVAKGGASITRIYRAGDGAIVETLEAGGAAGVCFTPDGKSLITGNGSDVGVWDTKTWKRTVTLADTSAHIIALSPDGSRLVTADFSNFFVWTLPLTKKSKPDKFSLTKTSDVGTPTADAIAWSPDGATFAVGGGTGGMIAIVDPATGKAVAAVKTSHATTSLAFSRDGKWLAAGSRDGLDWYKSGKLALYASWAEDATGITAIAYGAGGKTITIGQDDGSLRELDPDKDDLTVLTTFGPGDGNDPETPDEGDGHGLTPPTAKQQTMIDAYLKKYDAVRLLVAEVANGWKYSQQDIDEMTKNGRACHTDADALIADGIDPATPLVWNGGLYTETTVEGVKAICDQAAGIAEGEQAKKDALIAPYKKALKGDKWKIVAKEPGFPQLRIYGKKGAVLPEHDGWTDAAAMKKSSIWCTQGVNRDGVVPIWDISCYVFKGNKKLKTTYKTGEGDRAPASAFPK